MGQDQVSGGVSVLCWLATSVAGWLVVLRIYVALTIFQPDRDLEAGDKQSLKS